MKITMVVPYFKPEITAIVHLMDDLAHDLEKYGANITVITSFPTRGINLSIGKEYLHKEVDLISKNIKIIHVGSKRGEGNSFFIRGMKYLLKTYAFYRAAKRVPTDVFYIYSTPPSMGIIGALLSKNVPTLYCLQDIFPDNLSAQGKINNNSVVYRLFNAVEAYIYKNNTFIVTISNDMKKNLIEKKVDVNKISVIGNWIDTDELKYVKREDNPLFDQFELDRAGFYVTYSGNLGYAQDIDIILECAKITLRTIPEIQYIIVGSGVCETKIKKRIRDENIENVQLFPLRPEEESAYVYSLGDIGLVTLKNSMSRYAMPSKTWAMMSVSLPMICTAEKNSELYEIISQTEAGVLIKPGDYIELENQIRILYSEKDKIGIYGKNGRCYAEKNLSREEATKKYFNLLFEMAEKASFKDGAY